ncbi:hypothetical protein Clacol_003791 [Clathrus columnatus]|uniref:Uncharacterized protein n=1 Tax=Clathrus columnatus TaxID=1419009 RepID=A0AAV5AAA1_9AGAM|nr:hypothetical protein Clacol_003791 [Clathrus columnatus]
MTFSNTDDIFRDLYQTTDELRQASRAINIAYDRLQALRDSLTSFQVAAQRDRLRSRQSRTSSDDEHDRIPGLITTSRRRLLEQSMSNIPSHSHSVEFSPSEFVPNSRRRRSIHPSSSFSGVGTNALSIHTRRSMLESHLRSIRRILESSLSTTYLGRQTIQRVTVDSTDSDQSNEDSLSPVLDQYPSSSSGSRVIESRAAAAHLRLSFLPNPISRPSNTRTGSSLTRTRTIRSNSETALTRPPSSNLDPPLSQLSAHPSSISSEAESTNHLFNDFVRLYWPQRQDDQSPDAVLNTNLGTFASDSENLGSGYRSSSSSSQTTEMDDNNMIIDSTSSYGYGRRNSDNSIVRLDLNGDEIMDNTDQTIRTDAILHPRNLGYDNVQPGYRRSRESSANIIQYTAAESIQVGSLTRKGRELKVKKPEKATVLKRLFNPQPGGLYIANNPLPGKFLCSNSESNRVVVRVNTVAGR